MDSLQWKIENLQIFDRIKWPQFVLIMIKNYCDDMPEIADTFINTIINHSSVTVVGLYKNEKIVKHEFVSIRQALEMLPNLAISYKEYDIPDVYGLLYAIQHTPTIADQPNIVFTSIKAREFLKNV